MAIGKKWAAGLLGVTLGAALAVQAFAAGGLTAAQAKAFALGYLPKDSVHLKTEDEGYKYELEFYSESRGESYEVQVDKFEQKLLAFESGLVPGHGSREVALSEEDAKKVVTAELPEVEIVAVALDMEDWFREYKVQFQAGDRVGHYEINPETGAVLERKIEFIEAADTAAGGMLTMEQARRIVLEKVPGAVIHKMKFDRDDGRAIYEGEMRKGLFEYEFEIDAATGAILDWDVDYDD